MTCETTAEPSGHTQGNRLRFEKSPYLLQHAGNPVDWYPWGPEAFEKAAREDKPVFLSVGYSTCHWCHVMESESFEDAEVARLLNRVFVCVKVDREERPDIDGVYMSVCQAVTGGGGWPLTIIMTPQKKPFFADTYIPKQARFGRIGLMELVPRIESLWKARRADVLESADQIATAVRGDRVASVTTDPIGRSDLDSAARQLALSFDHRHGGFGSAPKFPMPHHLLFLLRYAQRTDAAFPLEMVRRTLDRMRLGGIYDHLGFGFHRYSVDERWMVPHFEKMLYDQALLALAYTEAYQALGDRGYRKTAEEILSYVLRDMVDSRGGFHSAEDADSDGREGKYYLWTEEGVRRCLAPDEAGLFLRVCSVLPEGNFVDPIQGRSEGENVLHLSKPLSEWAAELGISEQEVADRFEAARSKLLASRCLRRRPDKDDKVLTDWNGLMIAALARAAVVFEDETWAESARGAADFVLETLRTPEGRLLHRYRAGEAGLQAHLEDYAFLIWGLIELYQVGFEARYLNTALELQEMLTRHHWDDQVGGFFQTANDAEELLVRPKEVYDGAVPSGNSVAAMNLLRLARMTGDVALEAHGQRLLEAFADRVREAPAAHTFLMLAVDYAVGPSCDVVIVGDSRSEDTRMLLSTARLQRLPRMDLLLKDTCPGAVSVGREVLTGHMASADGRATAYVCSDRGCAPPTTDPSRMVELLQGVSCGHGVG